jgi:biotin carboxylase
MGVDQTVLFRDKERMKQVLDGAGIRTPRHASAQSASAVLEAAAYVGYPLILKPIAGAGSKDTYRCDTKHELDEAVRRLGHVDTVSVEEFIDGEDWTFDTVCVDGQIQFFNLCFYRPRALLARQHQWISPQTFAIRRVDQPELEPGRAMGRAVLQALGF